MKFETSAIHCGTDVDPTSGAIVKPVTMSVTFGSWREFCRANR